MNAPFVFVHHQGELRSDLDRAISALGPEVMNVTYRLDTDSTGDPAIYFHIVLADWAADTEDRIADTTGRVAGQLLARLGAKWALQPYFNWGKAPLQPAGRTA
jgi:hypothetical protein